MCDHDEAFAHSILAVVSIGNKQYRHSFGINVLEFVRDQHLDIYVLKSGIVDLRVHYLFHLLHNINFNHDALSNLSPAFLRERPLRLTVRHDALTAPHPSGQMANRILADGAINIDLLEHVFELIWQLV